jgi:hypothetical protein
LTHHPVRMIEPHLLCKGGRRARHRATASTQESG